MAGKEQDVGDRAMSFWVSVARLPKAGMPLHFEAGDDERVYLARRLEIPAVRRLEADMTVSPWRSGGVKVSGRLVADVVQTSIVTLDDLPQRVEEEIDVVFVPETSKLARVETSADGELHLDPEGEDIPETFSGDRIDIGELLCEMVALGLDPYPREADAAFDRFDTDPDPEKAPVSPFASLANLRRRDE